VFSLFNVIAATVDADCSGRSSHITLTAMSQPSMRLATPDRHGIPLN